MTTSEKSKKAVKTLEECKNEYIKKVVLEAQSLKKEISSNEFINIKRKMLRNNPAIHTGAKGSVYSMLEIKNISNFKRKIKTSNISLKPGERVHESMKFSGKTNVLNHFLITYKEHKANMMNFIFNDNIKSIHFNI